MGGTFRFFSALSNLYHFYHDGLYSARKYVGECVTFIYRFGSLSSEQFSNGITIISLYLNPLPGSQAPPIEHSIFLNCLGPSYLQLHRLRRSIPNKHERFPIFNKMILGTNFYEPTKVALSLHLTPDFLPEVEYPRKLNVLRHR